jgi:hypothetical protein
MTSCPYSPKKPSLKQFLFWRRETGSHYVAQAGLELMILMLLPCNFMLWEGYLTSNVDIA